MTYETEHFSFTLSKEGLSYLDIGEIGKKFEDKYYYVKRKLELETSIKIKVLIFDREDELQSRFEVKKNNYLIYPDELFYVYSNAIRCFDFSPLVDLLISDELGKNGNFFLNEGLIGYVLKDEKVALDEVKKYLKEDKYMDINELIDNDYYLSNAYYGEVEAVCFFKYLYDTYGLECIKSIYKNKYSINKIFENVLGDNPIVVNVDFLQYINIK